MPCPADKSRMFRDPDEPGQTEITDLAELPDEWEQLDGETQAQ